MHNRELCELYQCIAKTDQRGVRRFCRPHAELSTIFDSKTCWTKKRGAKMVPQVRLTVEERLEKRKKSSLALEALSATFEKVAEMLVKKEGQLA